MTFTKPEADAIVAKGDTAQLELLKSAEVVDADGNKLTYVIEKTPAIDNDTISKMVADEVAKIQKAATPAAPAVLPAKPEGIKADVVEHIHEKSTKFADSKAAHRLGHYFKAAAGIRASAEWCENHGLSLKHNSFDDTQGGFLVPDEFRPTLIALLNEYGAARRLGEVVPMSRDTLTTPKLASNLTASFVGQGNAGTNSNNAFTAVNLVAKKVLALTSVTKELLEDSPVSVADLLLPRLAYSIALREDTACIAGDGTATNGGIVGLTQRLSTINGTDDGGGLVLGAGNLYSELTLANFHAVQGRVASYAWGFGGPSWLMSRAFYYAAPKRLQFAAGGTTPVDIANGVTTERFLGYPVIFSDAMPTTEANSQICALFGNFGISASFGDRKQFAFETAMTGSVTIGGNAIDLFASDQAAFKAVTRFDYVFHDAGTATVAGGVVGLITAAS